eukprot:SAG11_NODE_4967_length_1708_cov_0.960845_1_plen_235_part_00
MEAELQRTAAEIDVITRRGATLSLEHQMAQIRTERAKRAAAEGHGSASASGAAAGQAHQMAQVRTERAAAEGHGITGASGAAASQAEQLASTRTKQAERAAAKGHGSVSASDAAVGQAQQMAQVRAERAAAKGHGGGLEEQQMRQFIAMIDAMSPLELAAFQHETGATAAQLDELRRAVPSAAMGGQLRAPAPPQVNEESATMLVEMGFVRAEVKHESVSSLTCGGCETFRECT